MKSLFSVLPSDAVIEKAVQSIGFDSLQDIREVDETMLNFFVMEQVKDALRAAYYPCFTKQFLDSDKFDFKRWITIIRQLLRLKGRKLLRRETSEKIDRGVYRYTSRYRLDLPPAACCEVSFP